MKMKLLTVRPPWADAVACLAKRWETRSWPTSYRGALGIHSGSGNYNEIRGFLGVQAFQDALAPLRKPGVGHVCMDDVHRGAIVAVCRLEDCRPTLDLSIETIRRECELGDFTPGRYAWLLTDVVRLARPVPLRGQLGLFDAPVWLRRQIVSALPAGVPVNPVIRAALGMDVRADPPAPTGYGAVGRTDSRATRGVMEEVFA